MIIEYLDNVKRNKSAFLFVPCCGNCPEFTETSRHPLFLPGIIFHIVL